MGLLDNAQKLASMGRYGDTMLAHINPEEAMLLKALGGSGTINPRTGLPEFNWFSDAWKNIKSGISEASSAVGDFGTSVDRFVRDVVPGGWATPARIAAAIYSGGTSEAGFEAADAAQLAAQGLSESQIADTLIAGGADAFAAADAAQLAAQGLSASQIETILSQQTLSPYSGGGTSVSLQDALKGARLISSLSGGQQQPMGYGGQQQPAQQGGLYGAVDYTPILSLLATRPTSTTLV